MEKRPAGSLTRFLRHLETGLKKESVEVPCGSCRACCSDPEFQVDISDEEAKRFPYVEVLGRKVLPRQENGACINLNDGICSVYADRPRTCRIYDCRYHLFGMPLHQDCKHMQEAVASWEPFRLPTTEDKVAWGAIMVLIAQFVKQDPTLTGLAYLLLKWPLYRDQSYNLLQDIKREDRDGHQPEPPYLSR